jgi:hypothetical protein
MKSLFFEAKPYGMAFPFTKQTWIGLALLSMLLLFIVTLKKQALLIEREDILGFEAPTDRTIPPLTSTEAAKRDEFLTQELESDTTPRLPLILCNLPAVDDIKNKTSTETAQTTSLQNNTTDVSDEPERKAPRQSQERKPHTRHGTKAGDTTQLNRTKIVGFINEAYIGVGIRWYDRLTTLGYTEHVIVTTDNSTSAVLESEYPRYRMEKSYRPPLSQKYPNIPPEQQRRKEIEMIFGQRWLYTLQQLKMGHHILITDVDNIFSKYHPMSSMELSEYDVFHALETKYPVKVYNATGFVVCGGMGWFRSTPSTIDFVQLLTDRCNGTCDDQVKLNSLLAFEMEMEWNLTDWHKSIRTHRNRSPILNGLLERGFTGVSKITGHKVLVWDRDFAYRGENNPEVCPVDNWVSMPLVTIRSRSKSWRYKLRSFDRWDAACPNGYSNMTMEPTTTVKLK